MIAGNADARSRQPKGIVAWSCGAVGGKPRYYTIPACTDDETLQLQATFPNCWDGRRLDSPDHKQHMKYASRGICPSSHPVATADDHPHRPLPARAARLAGRVGASRRARGLHERLGSGRARAPRRGAEPRSVATVRGTWPRTPCTHLTRPAAAEPDGLLVLFHGRGADERDLFPLLDLLDPERRMLGVTPRGPLHLPPGGAHWYAVQEIGYPDPGDVHRDVRARVVVARRRRRRRGHPLRANRHRRLLAGRRDDVRARARRRPAATGRADRALRVHADGARVRARSSTHHSRASRSGTERSTRSSRSSGAATRASRLAAAGADVTYRESPHMAHSIDPAFFRELPAWLAETLGVARMKLSTGAEMRVTGAIGECAVVCVNGGQAREVEGTWSASIEWLVQRLAPRLPELGFAEVRYRVKSWRRLESCVDDARAAVDEIGRAARRCSSASRWAARSRSRSRTSRRSRRSSASRPGSPTSSTSTTLRAKAAHRHPRRARPLAPRNPRRLGVALAQGLRPRPRTRRGGPLRRSSPARSTESRCVRHGESSSRCRRPIAGPSRRGGAPALRELPARGGLARSTRGTPRGARPRRRLRAPKPDRAVRTLPTGSGRARWRHVPATAPSTRNVPTDCGIFVEKIRGR